MTRIRFPRFLPALALGLALVPTAASAQKWFRLDGYGEFLYQHHDFGPNQNLPNGSEPDSRATMDMRRFNLALYSAFSDSVTFKVEIEFEHGGTGSAMELEYEEFGEYEFEVEKGGEIVLEQIHITKSFSPALNLRIGEIKVPVGLTNNYHDPTRYLGSVRPESEENLIPNTWHERGVAAFGAIRDFQYRVQVVNALDSTGFSSRNWIVEGKQQRFEQSLATDLAVAGLLEYSPRPGFILGVSAYRGNSTRNRPKKDMEGVDGHVTIGAGHFVFEGERLSARAGFLHGQLANSDLISARNASISRNIQSPRTPVARAARGWSAEIGYDVGARFLPDDGSRLVPFLRYERYDPMYDTEGGVFDVPRFDNSVTTVGAVYFLKGGVALKADYSMRKVGRGDYNDENTYSVALAFTEPFFEHSAQP